MVPLQKSWSSIFTAVGLSTGLPSYVINLQAIQRGNYHIQALIKLCIIISLRKSWNNIFMAVSLSIVSVTVSCEKSSTCVYRRPSHCAYHV